ncbi:GrpB family protein [Ralstonia pickettii]|nr:GrpB family protein [Ralstonia pickettii]
MEVTVFNKEWAVLFEEEAEKIKYIFGENLISIDHIGSTSVAGLKAKPIIDIMPVVKNIYLVDQNNEEMQKLGYEPMGEFGIAGRRYFRKGQEKRTHHVHIFQEGSPDIKRHIAFRDYLRAHPNLRDRYGALKSKLAEQFPFDKESYINGKDALVKEIEAQALEWFDAISK